MSRNELPIKEVPNLENLKSTENKNAASEMNLSHFGAPLRLKRARRRAKNENVSTS